MPTIDLTDAELAVAAAIKRVIEEDKFPRAPGLRQYDGMFAAASAGREIKSAQR